MKKENSEPNFTAEQQAELTALELLPESEIDLRSIPEQADWSDARRGLFFRPIKQQVTLRLDADIVDWFRIQGKGHLSRMNTALRSYMENHKGPG